MIEEFNKRVKIALPTSASLSRLAYVTFLMGVFNIGLTQKGGTPSFPCDMFWEGIIIGAEINRTGERFLAKLKKNKGNERIKPNVFFAMTSKEL